VPAQYWQRSTTARSKLHATSAHPACNRPHFCTSTLAPTYVHDFEKRG
jgi:hypothetical protein